MTYAELSKVNEKLQSIDVKGKQYVQVNTRVLAFRELYPNGSITTDIVSLADGMVVCKTTIADEDGKVLATGLAYEKESSSFINKTSYIENCETSSVGRALGMLGIGVDGSICSAEEVANAINNQEQPKPAPKKNKEITPEQRQELSSFGVAIEQVAQYFHKEVPELNYDDVNYIIVKKRAKAQ